MSIESRTARPRHALRPRTLWLLNQATLTVRSRLEQRLRALQLTGIQYTVLTMVHARPGLSSAALSRRFFVTPQTMNETVLGLERRGALVRAEHPDNRRIRILSLTDAGRALMREADAVADEIESEAFDWLSADDFADLRHLLRMVLRGPHREGEK